MCWTCRTEQSEHIVAKLPFVSHAEQSEHIVTKLVEQGILSQESLVCPMSSFKTSDAGTLVWHVEDLC